jgi:hypothetical protein
VTARQKEIVMVREGIRICKEVVIAEEAQYRQAVADVEAGIRDVDSSSPEFYRNSINEVKGWLKAEEERLAVLESQEIAR